MLLVNVVVVIILVVAAAAGAAVVFFILYTEVNQDFAGVLSENVISSFLWRFACFDCASSSSAYDRYKYRNKMHLCTATATNPIHRPSHDAITPIPLHYFHAAELCTNRKIRIIEIQTQSHTEMHTRASHIHTHTKLLVWMQQEKERERAVGTVVFVKESDVVIVCQP